MLRIAAALEKPSEHPLAGAILTEAASRGIVPGAVADFRAVTGKGIAGTLDGVKALVGTADLLAEQGIDCAGLAAQAEGFRRRRRHRDVRRQRRARGGDCSPSPIR